MKERVIKEAFHIEKEKAKKEDTGLGIEKKGSWENRERGHGKASIVQAQRGHLHGSLHKVCVGGGREEEWLRVLPTPPPTILKPQGPCCLL